MKLQDEYPWLSLATVKIKRALDKMCEPHIRLLTKMDSRSRHTYMILGTESVIVVLWNGEGDYTINSHAGRCFTLEQTVEGIVNTILEKTDYTEWEITERISRMKLDEARAHRKELLCRF